MNSLKTCVKLSDTVKEKKMSDNDSTSLFENMVEFCRGKLSDDDIMKLYEIVQSQIDWERTDAQQELAYKFGHLVSETRDMCQGYESRKQLDEGFKGMGHNILTECAGRFRSPSLWRKLRERCEECSKILEEVLTRKQ